jgi:curli biogenesis system outer membrane secretion channel CsgG
MPVNLAQFARGGLVLAIGILLAGCSDTSAIFTKSSANAELVQGPPIEDVVTSFDQALSCLRGRIPRNVIFAVGGVTDATGKESYADGSAGKFVTQGAGEMIQSSLFRAGVSVVNRRDDNISVMESNWGIRDIKRQVPVNFYISGSINSLDFIPGGGFSAQIAGVGPRYRQSRILVALDLTMTDAYTGRVVANIPLQKQIFTKETGASANTFFGQTLIQMDAGGMEREAINFALRQMLSLATFEMLGQLMDPAAYAPCLAKVESGAGSVNSSGTGDRAALKEAVAAMNNSGKEAAAALAVPVSSGRMPVAQGPQQAGAAAAAASPTPGSIKGHKAVQAATLAIRAAKESMESDDSQTSVKKAADALQISNVALLLLKEAAGEGFGGDEGDVAAVMVQQALQAAKEAGTAAANRITSGKQKPKPAVPNPAVTTAQPPTNPVAPAEATPAQTDPVQTTPIPAAPLQTPPAPGSLADQRKAGGSK